MVSTRGVRYKFSEGERVLCYEPDPTKAKVLYDSKVLEVIESKDKRGRRTVEYLIHFQGWNSSWDRCVSEDFVLKDTEENRQLQRDLAEKSQLQLGAYLYRRERKKGSTSSAGAAPAKRGRHGFSDDGSSSSTQPDEGTTEGEAEPEVETEAKCEAEAEHEAEAEVEADGDGEVEDDGEAEDDGEVEADDDEGEADDGEGEADDGEGEADDGDGDAEDEEEAENEVEAEDEGEAAGEASADTDSSSGSAGSGSQQNSPQHNLQTGRANIILPSALRDRLTFDYHLVVKRGRLSRLPAVPCAAFILESFVKWFVRAGAWSTPRGRHDAPQPRPDLLDVACRLNLVREVADGLRVYFDFILRGHLLYKQELNQYHEICGQFIEQQEKQYKEEYDDDQSQEESSDAEEDMKSPKIPEYSHLPPDPAPKEKQMPAENPETKDEEMKEIKQEIKDEDDEPDDEAHEDTKPVIVKEEEKSPKEEPKPEIKEEIKDEDEEKPTPIEEDPHSFANEVRRETRPATRNLARRLRSHKSIVSQSENEEPMPSTSGTSGVEPKVFETMSSSVCSSGSSMSEGWALSGGTAPPAQAAPAPAPATSTRTPLSLLLEKVAKWQIIPREGTEHLPCRVYGAIHLARLFVKLPDFLNATQMPDMKLKLIVKHIDMFVQYLDEHSEWFGETYYIADNLSRCT